MEVPVRHRVTTEVRFVTKEHLDHLGRRLNVRMDRLEERVVRLENRVNLILSVAVLVILTPAINRVLVGP